MRRAAQVEDFVVGARERHWSACLMPGTDPERSAGMRSNLHENSGRCDPGARQEMIRSSCSEFVGIHSSEGESSWDSGASLLEAMAREASHARLSLRYWSFC